MYQASLVLEGGGMKGVYTAGILDFFMDKGLSFSSCYGVSAGACLLGSFLSGQRERGYRVTVDYLDDKHYCSMYSLLTTGDLFGAKMCYHTIPEQLNPYDYEAFSKYKGNFYTVVTNIETGETEYIPIKDMKKDIEVIRASASLPLVSRNVEIQGKYYLDGGISDAIPIRRSIADGNTKNIVVLTKETGYRRKQDSTLPLMKLRYRKYPKIYELMQKRNLVYNETLDYLERQVEEGSVFLIRPSQPSAVGRIEKDRDKLRALYEQGYQDGVENYAQLMEFLGQVEEK